MNAYAARTDHAESRAHVCQHQTRRNRCRSDRCRERDGRGIRGSDAGEPGAARYAATCADGERAREHEHRERRSDPRTQPEQREHDQRQRGPDANRGKHYQRTTNARDRCVG
jgi:hypothetical protein